ncbi:MAG: hypothetical protein MUE98_15320, partial [Rhodobacteraceae bacterium]|nr:hypothetical protein [Paracoccaceae bacterium]
DGVTGFVVDDLEAAVAAVPAALALDRRAVRLAFERRFCADRMVDDYVEAYGRLARSPQTSGAP